MPLWILAEFLRKMSVSFHFELIDGERETQLIARYITQGSELERKKRNLDYIQSSGNLNPVYTILF